jgi:DNA repair protein RecO (recombination protein O)
MSGTIRSQAAYLLHSRPFRDSSLLLDLLTRDHGRISAIARGVRSVKSKNKALLQSFVPLQVNLYGKSELKTLTQVEALSAPLMLRQRKLFAALYMNELLSRLLHRQEGDAHIFSLYESSLGQLSSADAIEPVLRCFEIDLLELLGYGIDFSLFAEDDQAEDAYYYFNAEQGFELVHNPDEKREKYYPHAELCKIYSREFGDGSTLKFAKRLLRTAFSVHIGDRELSSRQLFRKNN